MTASASLKRLDNATRSKIRSTQILTSLPQIISELIQNSLDAGAKNIEIGVHCGDWLCWVLDDGSGINKDGLSLIAQGIEGGRYSSSKSHTPASLDELNTFGFRGEALASAADLSCLEISSRTFKSKESWSIILKGGEKLYYGPSLRWRREGAGTTVSIRDAFFNLPIRRMSHPSPARTFDLVRRELQTFALVFPQVKFSLRDLSKEENEGADRSRIMTIPRTPSTLLTFRHLYGRTLVDRVDIIDCESDSMRIDGFLSLIGSPSKAYLNHHILDACELHRVIDKCFSSSTFAKHALDELGESKISHSNLRRSPKKRELRPVYVLNIAVPPREIDNCLEPAKAVVHLQNQDAIVSFLADVIQSFLSRQGFKTSTPDVASRDYEHPSCKRRRVIAHHDDGENFGQRDESQIDTPECTSDSKESAMNLFIEGPSVGNEHREFRWVDPNTGRMYLIDPRTGNSYLPEQRCHDLENGESCHVTRQRTIVDEGWPENSRQMRESARNGDGNRIPDWITQALEANDVFASGEPSVPCLPSSKATTEGVGNIRRMPWTKQINQAFSVPTSSMNNLVTIPDYSFTKESLSVVQVLGQIDCKFIACLLDTPSATNTSEDWEEKGQLRTLVLVDQHAADERVRVERLLKSLCLGYLDRDGVGVERRMLDPPVPVLLTTFERNRLMRSTTIKKTFRDWGFSIVEDEIDHESEKHTMNDSDEGYGMIHFSSVPEVAADKLLSGSSSDLCELVKGYLARFESGNINNCSMHTQQLSSAVDDVDAFTWLKALRNCPRELVELINSRACRGAIMFNDRLSMEQCKRLLRQLSMTAFPFQCAHGRPTVVPLTTVGPRLSAESARFGKINWGSLV
ncbi:MLH3 [Sanghuangporus weigelae]